MSRSHLRFQVDSRLATLLSQEYSSSERALKELVDNAWDADAERVLVTLPKGYGHSPNGCSWLDFPRLQLFLITTRQPGLP